MAAFVICIVLSAIVILVVIVTFILYVQKYYKKPIEFIYFSISEFIKNTSVQYIPVDKNKHLKKLVHSINVLLRTIKKLEFEKEKRLKELEDELEKKRNELENIQNCLTRTEKLVAIGKLSAGVVHEINNHLTGVLTSCYFVNDNTRKSKVVEDEIKIIIDETNKCKKIADELLNFAQDNTPQKEMYNVNKLLDDVFTLINKQAVQSNVDVIKKLTDDILLTRFDPSQLEQVFLNVMINALEAMPDGGTVTIQSQVKNNGTQIEISFTDTGMGIPKESLEKIFEPFYTTKSNEGGTGLGLTICREIIKDHNGTIEIKSFIDVGTMVVITLPVIG